MASTRNERDFGELHAVLDKAFPQLRNADQGLDVYRLARLVGVSHTTLYNSFNRGGLGMKTGRRIIDLSEGRLTRRKLARFLPIV